MSHLLLHNRKRQFSINHIVGDMTVPQAMNRKHLQISPHRIFPIDLLQSSLGDIVLKYLPDAIFCIWLIPTFSGVK